jgi:hypothetical protein
MFAEEIGPWRSPTVRLGLRGFAHHFRRELRRGWRGREVDAPILHDDLDFGNPEISRFERQ